MTRRPAAHNPMVFRKTTKPAGHACTAPGCAGYVLAGQACQVCAFNLALAELEAKPIPNR